MFVLFQAIWREKRQQINLFLYVNKILKINFQWKFDSFENISFQRQIFVLIRNYLIVQRPILDVIQDYFLGLFLSISLWKEKSKQNNLKMHNGSKAINAIETCRIYLILVTVKINENMYLSFPTNWKFQTERKIAQDRNRIQILGFQG